MKGNNVFERIDSPPKTLREIALGRMRDAIIGGIFDSGQRLIERNLCDQLGVSRSVIREVIRHLEAEGLVESIPNHGPIVARLDWDQARQIYDIRVVLEASAVSDCAVKADNATKKLLREALGSLENTDQNTDPTAVLTATTEFYKIIFETAGRQVAWEVVQRLNGRISRLRVMTLSTGDRIIIGPSRIREIFAAIDNNNPKAAAAACRRHVSEARAIAEQLLKKKENQSV